MMRVRVDINNYNIRGIRIVRREPLGDPSLPHAYEYYAYDRHGVEFWTGLIKAKPADSPLSLVALIIEDMKVAEDSLWYGERYGSQYDPQQEEHVNAKKANQRKTNDRDAADK